MKLSNLVLLLGMIFFASEVALSVFRRSAAKAQAKDSGSLWMLWVVLILGVQLGAFATKAWPHTHFRQMERWQIAGCLLLPAGLALRWWSILYLGRFFTVNVAVHEGHRVVDAGPYRHIRHPAYTGALVAFLGMGLGFGSWLSVLLVLIPAFLAYAWRIRIEERALLEALGENYQTYRRRTKRLIPFVY